jgi:hypothetical protein
VNKGRVISQSKLARNHGLGWMTAFSVLPQAKASPSPGLQEDELFVRCIAMLGCAACSWAWPSS